jgi:hypothetical protein
VLFIKAFNHPAFLRLIKPPAIRDEFGINATKQQKPFVLYFKTDNLTMLPRLHYGCGIDFIFLKTTVRFRRNNVHAGSCLLASLAKFD